MLGYSAIALNKRLLYSLNQCNLPRFSLQRSVKSDKGNFSSLVALFLAMLILRWVTSSQAMSTVVVSSILNTKFLRSPLSGRSTVHYPAPDRGRGIVMERFLSLFICFVVSNITRKWLDRFAWNFQGRCEVTMRRPDSILGQFE